MENEPSQRAQEAKFIELATRSGWKQGESISFPVAFEIAKAFEADSTAGLVEAQIIRQIEERFPNWPSYRDLIDCIDCTLSDLRKGSRL